ncbi:MULTISPECIES: hypothetical protein [Bacillus]|uniref:hypothetical protein n=1 Tax=Bacillus TaxID=1386 RepID=UPI0003095C9F|nr:MULTISPECIES: hypothetical protein [Bacillus]
MNKLFSTLLGEVVQLELSRKNVVVGTLIDFGSDLIVVYNGNDYIYMPIFHMKNIKLVEKIEDEIMAPMELPSISVDENLSLRKALTLAKGTFVEIYVTNEQTLHGYITSIMNNYFVFYSPIYKTMFITLNHLKWLIPYKNNQKPYGLSNQDFPLQPAYLTLARTFEVQIEKLKNEVVMFNLGENNNVIGKVNNVESNIIELQTAKNPPIYLNIHHIKTVHKA